FRRRRIQQRGRKGQRVRENHVRCGSDWRERTAQEGVRQLTLRGRARVRTGAFLPLHFLDYRGDTTPRRGTHVVALPLEGDCSRFGVIGGALSKFIDHNHRCPPDCAVVAQSLYNPWNRGHVSLPPTPCWGFGNGKNT